MPRVSKGVIDADVPVCQGIKECLIISKKCLEGINEKGNMTTYGMPALILLCTVIDAIGAYFEGGFHSEGHQYPTSIDFSDRMKMAHYKSFYDEVVLNKKWGGRYGAYLRSSIMTSQGFNDNLCKPYRNRALHTVMLQSNCFIDIIHQRAKYRIFEKTTIEQKLSDKKTGTTCDDKLILINEYSYVYLEPLYNFLHICFLRLLRKLHIKYDNL